MLNHDGAMLLGGGYMWLFWILLALLILLAVKLVFSADKKFLSESEDTPLSILKKRYAKGEIDEEEFERRKKEIQT